MSTETTDSKETDAQHSDQPDAGTPPDGIRCICGSEQLVVLETTITIDHKPRGDPQRRTWALKCTECTQIATPWATLTSDSSAVLKTAVPLSTAAFVAAMLIGTTRRYI